MTPTLNPARPSIRVYNAHTLPDELCEFVDTKFPFPGTAPQIDATLFAVTSILTPSDAASVLPGEQERFLADDGKPYRMRSRWEPCYQGLSLIALVHAAPAERTTWGPEAEVLAFKELPEPAKAALCSTDALPAMDALCLYAPKGDGSVRTFLHKGVTMKVVGWKQVAGGGRVSFLVEQTADCASTGPLLALLMETGQVRLDTVTATALPVRGKAVSSQYTGEFVLSAVTVDGAPYGRDAKGRERLIRRYDDFTVDEGGV